MLRYYGVDLVDLFDEVDPLLPSRVLVLIYGLPTESRSIARISGNPDSEGWGVGEYLLASTVNAVREGTYTNIQVRTKKKIKPPEDVKVPGVGEVKKSRPNRFALMAQAQLGSVE